MKSAQPSQFRSVVITLVLFFGFVSLVLGLTIRQLRHLPEATALQVEIAAVPVADIPYEAQSVLLDATQWNERRARLSTALDALANHQREHPAANRQGLPTVLAAWNNLKPSLDVLATAAEPRDAPPHAIDAGVKLRAALLAAARAAEDSAAVRISKLQIFHVSALAAGALLLLVLVLHVVRNLGTEERAVAISQKETEHILSTVNEGLFLLDRELIIGAEHSAVLTQILHRESLAGTSFKDLLSAIVPGKTLATALDFVGLLWSDRVEEDLIKSINPLNEVEVHFASGNGSFETHYLKFDFKRVSAGGQMVQVLVSVTDVTESVLLRLELQHAQAASEAQMDLLMSILHVAPEQLQSFLAESEASLHMANAILRQPASREPEFRTKITELFRAIHGIKSDAAGLGLPTVESKAHSFEDDLQQLRETSELSGKDLLGLPIKLDDLLSHFAAIHALVGRITALRSAFDTAPAQRQATTIIARESASPVSGARVSAGRSIEASGRDVPVSETLTNKILSGEASATESPTVEASALATPAANSADETLSLLQNLAARLARELGKRVQVQASGLERLPADYRGPVKDVVTQLVRNALTHGIESPSERSAIGKSTAGTICIEVAPDAQNGLYHLNVEDDGRGLSADRIRRTAVERGLLSEADARNADGMRLIALIFKPGFSTVPEVTSHAGRGVGLDIVKSIVDRLGGRIGVAGKAGRFTRFRISLPMRESAAA